MARPWIDPDRVARILIWALVHGDASACAEFGVILRTVQRYRVTLGSNQQLSEAVAIRLKELRESDNYEERVGQTIYTALGFLERACSEMDARDPDSVTAVTEALKALFSFEVANKILNARLNEYRSVDEADGAPREGVQQVAPAQTLRIEEG